jgi:hypothetical protein
MKSLTNKIATVTVALLVGALFSATFIIAVYSCNRAANTAAASDSPPPAVEHPDRWQQFKALGAGPYIDTVAFRYDTTYSSFTEYTWGIVEEYRDSDVETITVTRYLK